VTPPAGPIPTDQPTDPSRLGRIRALAAFDADGPLPVPGPIELLVRWTGPSPDPAVEILALGSPDIVAAHPLAPRARPIDRSNCVLIPGLVNAHTHLDLTHIGPRPHDPAVGFVPWIDMIRRERRSDPAAIAASVRRGVELLRAGGTVAVGDIAGAVGGKPSRLAVDALASTGMPGVSFIEYFGLLTPYRELVALLRAVAEPVDGPLRVGLQPHAPYTVSLPGYTVAIESANVAGFPMSTHLAESPEERELIVHARGPLRDLLTAVLGDPSGWIDQFALARSPIAHALRLPWPPDQPRGLAVHVNDCDDEDLRLLAERRAIVVYCPRSSAYFGADRHFGPHRYRDMLAAGIPVALGTDSIVNLPPEAANPVQGGISILDEMRLLHRRDGTDFTDLLAMGTINALEAFPFINPAHFRFPMPTSTASPIARLLDSASAAPVPLPRMAGVLAVPVSPGTPPLEWLSHRAGSLPPELLIPPTSPQSGA
jgi:aminodeoxyfutalosine deaminase